MWMDELLRVVGWNKTACALLHVRIATDGLVSHVRTTLRAQCTP